MSDRRLSGRRARLSKKLAVLSALSSLLFSSRAHAERLESLGVGAFVGYTFGPRGGLTWGLESFFTSAVRDDTCTNPPRSGKGMTVRVGWVNLRDARLTFAFHAGKEFRRDGPALTGEVGGTYRFGPEPGLGLHLGLQPESPILYAAARAELFLDDYSAVGGVRYFPTYGQGGLQCVIGRPLRSEGRRLEAGPSVRRVLPSDAAQRPPRPTDDDAALPAGSAWERDATDECASVPAFLQLARDLLARGAPLSLVERALDAAGDEILHAHLSAKMASKLLGVAVWPSLPDVPSQPVPSLVQLACESWLDGCVGEGAAAARAARAARLAGDRSARAVQFRIQQDEHRHADLAWDVLRWAFEEGGTDVHDAVRSLTPSTPVVAKTETGSLERYGQLAPADVESIFERHAADCVRRRDLLLAQLS